MACAKFMFQSDLLVYVDPAHVSTHAMHSSVCLLNFLTAMITVVMMMIHRTSCLRTCQDEEKQVHEAAVAPAPLEGAQAGAQEGTASLLADQDHRQVCFC